MRRTAAKRPFGNDFESRNYTCCSLTSAWLDAALFACETQRIEFKFSCFTFIKIFNDALDE